MKKETLREVEAAMAEYRRRGSPDFKRKQFKRLMVMLDDIFIHEPKALGSLKRIGRKAVIGYWQRINGESKQTRKEKWRVLKVLFEQLGKPEPPRPR